MKIEKDDEKIYIEILDWCLAGESTHMTSVIGHCTRVLYNEFYADMELEDFIKRVHHCIWNLTMLGMTSIYIEYLQNREDIHWLSNEMFLN